MKILKRTTLDSFSSIGDILIGTSGDLAFDGDINFERTYKNPISCFGIPVFPIEGERFLKALALSLATSSYYTVEFTEDDTWVDTSYHGVDIPIDKIAELIKTWVEEFKGEPQTNNALDRDKFYNELDTNSETTYGDATMQDWVKYQSTQNEDGL